MLLQIRPEIHCRSRFRCNKKLMDRPWENPTKSKCDTCAVHIVIITSAYSRRWTVQTCRPINFSSRILEVQVLQGWSANSTLQPSASSQPLCCQLLRCSQTNLEGEAVLHSSQPPDAHTIYAMHMQHIGILPPNHNQKFHTNVQHYVIQWPQRSLQFCLMRLSPFDNTTTWCSNSGQVSSFKITSRSLIGFSALCVDKQHEIAWHVFFWAKLPQRHQEPVRCFPAQMDSLLSQRPMRSGLHDMGLQNGRSHEMPWEFVSCLLRHHLMNQDNQAQRVLVHQLHLHHLHRIPLHLHLHFLPPLPPHLNPSDLLPCWQHAMQQPTANPLCAQTAHVPGFREGFPRCYELFQNSCMVAVQAFEVQWCFSHPQRRIRNTTVLRIHEA